MSENILTYRGYSGAVEFSAADGCFFGRILGIRDIVTFEGESVADLRKDFENAIDDYLATCAEIGKVPEHPCSGKLSLRLPVELHQELTLQSELTGKSVNSLVVEAVETLCKSKKRAAARLDTAKGRAGRRKAKARSGKQPPPKPRKRPKD